MSRAGKGALLVLALSLLPGAGPVLGAGPGGRESAIEDRYPRAAPAYLVEIDGTAVWGRAIDSPRAPASLAKIMTALVVLDERFDNASAVTISARAARETGSRLGVRAGEVMTAGALLDGMLVASANDAAVALAEHCAGSVDAFVARMNLQARRLGLLHTRFANPTGLDAKGQVSTVHDLRVLTEAALSRPDFTRRIALPRAVVSTTAGRRMDVASTNELLGRVEGVRGVKTGTTAKAGECLIALADRDGHRVVVVLLGAKERWWTASALLEAAFREASPSSGDPAGAPAGGASTPRHRRSALGDGARSGMKRARG